MPQDRSAAYKGYVLVLLSLVYAFAVMDRFLFGIIQESVKTEFSLSDFQLGLIGGPAFAVFYALGAPFVAKLAERYNRASLISTCLALWSAMTILCGFAGSFFHLILARIGIGVSESGCTPASHSLLSDYFSPSKRAFAISIFSAGGGVGIFLAGAVGGWISQYWGGRVTLFAVGGAGLVLALTLALTVSEPSRGTKRRTLPFLRTFALLWRTRSYRHAIALALGGILVAGGIGQFNASFFMRVHKMSMSEASVVAGLAGAVAMIGQILSGWLVHRTSHLRLNMVLLVPGLAMLLAGPAWLVGYSTSSASLAVPLIVVGFFFFSFQLGPVFAIPQLAVARAIRPTATAIMLLVGTLGGQAIGGPLLGFLSDAFGNAIAMQGHSVSTPCAMTSPACVQAKAQGLQYAMILWGIIPLVMVLNFWRASRYFEAEAKRYSGS